MEAATASDIKKKIRGESEDIVSRQKGVFEHPPENVPSRKTVDGPIMGNGDVGVTISGSPESLRFWISKNDFWKTKSVYPNSSPCPIGGVDIGIPALQDGTYRMEQRLDSAEVVGTFTTVMDMIEPPWPVTRAGVTISTRSWVAATENVLIIELSVDGDPDQADDMGWSSGAVAVDALVWPKTGNESETATGNLEDGYWAERRFVSQQKTAAIEQGDLKWPAEAAIAVRLFGHRKTTLPWISRADGWCADRFLIAPGSPVVIAASIVTNEEEKKPLQAVIDRIGRLTPEYVETLRASHRSWWADFWSKSYIDIGDELIQRFWYGSHYIMACCSRHRRFAPSLFGNWITTDSPSWQADYHLNYNHQAPWWGVYTSNHVELSDPYDTPILEYMPRAKENAKSFLNCRGVYYEVGIGPKGLTTCFQSVDALDDKKPLEKEDFIFLGMKSNAAYAAANMFMRFFLTYDMDYAEKVYPFMIEVASFWEDYLTYEDGRYVIDNDSVREIGEGISDRNNCVSLGFVRMLFKGIVEVSKELGRDEDRREKWMHILEHLSDFPTVEVDGVTRFRGAEEGRHAERIGPTRSDAHIEMQGIVWPSGVVGLGSDPGLLKVVKDELKDWPESIWIHSYNGFCICFTAAARAGHNPEDILEKLRKQLNVDGFPNLFVFGGGGGIENCAGVTACINEMLLQSHEGIIRLFPVWPKQMAARFGRLRAAGAFLVSSELDKAGVTHVIIESEKGRDCTVENPWPDQKISLHRDGRRSEILEGERFTIKTAVGECIHVAPDGYVS